MSAKLLVGQVRITASSETDLRELARHLGINLTTVNRSREQNGAWLGFGVAVTRRDAAPIAEPLTGKELGLWLDTCTVDEREAWKLANFKGNIVS